LLLQDGLEEHRVGVIVKVDNLLKVIFGLGCQLIQETFDDLSLSATSLSNKEW
jgi:hypothetical protein